MESGLITLNSALPIRNETVESPDSSSLINCFVSVAVLAEMAVSKAENFPWLIEEKLNNRRGSYELDKHLQNMLLFLNNRNGVSAKCIACGNSNYYKTEVILDNSIYVHFCRSFDKNAHYNKQYMEKNEDSSKFGFCCFEYALSKEKTTVTGIHLLIPRKSKPDIKIELSLNLTAMRKFFKKEGMTIEKELEALNWHQEQTDTTIADYTE